MGVISHNKHDVFVSYAHHDQLYEYGRDNAPGWVDEFLEDVRKTVIGKLDRRNNRMPANRIEGGFDVFWDLYLEKGQKLTPTLRDEVDTSGCCHSN